MKQSLIFLYERDITRLAGEFEGFGNTDHLWATSPGISNSAGNLFLHIAGNLRHFIGAILGNTGYIRDRAAEFATRGLAPGQLQILLGEMHKEVMSVLVSLPETRLEEDYPLEHNGRRFKVGEFLLHLYGHLNYHLGQINYLRRLLGS